MRTKHTPHSLPAFPVYSSAFISSDELVLGGGGGQSKSGIKNKLRLYRLGGDPPLELIHELELELGEDTPMSIAAHPTKKVFACGINSSEEHLKSGENENCRVYSMEADKLSLTGTQGTLKLTHEQDDFQKVTLFSPDGNLLAVAGSRDLSVLQFPSLSLAASAIHLPKDEIYDATFSSSTLVVATIANLLVYALPSASAQSSKQTASSIAGTALELIKTVDRPTLPGVSVGSSFRSARYHPHDEKVLYTVVNTVPPRTRAKSSPRRAYVCKWDTTNWTVIKLRQVGDRGLTCFDVSPNGKFLAFGSSDYTVGILDSQTLAPLLTILKAHDFPPTTLRFNPDSNLLVSGSADNTIRIVTVPASLGVQGVWSSWVIIIITLLIILLALLAQQLR